MTERLVPNAPVEPMTLELRALEALGDAVVIVSEQRRVVGWTGAARATFGYSDAEIVGQPLERILISEEVTALFHRGGFSARVEGAAAVRHKDGRDLPVVFTATPLRNADGRRVGWVCLVKDIGSWLRLQGPGLSARPLESVVLAAFHDITTRLAGSLDLEETVAAATSAVTDLVEADIAALSLVDHGRDLVSVRLSRGHRTRAFAEMRAERGFGLTWKALRSGRPLKVDDVRAVSAASAPEPALISERVRSLLLVPMRARGRTLGVLGAYRRSVKPFDVRAVFLLRMLAGHAALALDNALTYSQLVRSQGRVESLLASTEAIWRPLPVADLSGVVARQGAALVGGSEVVVWLASGPCGQMVRAAAGAGRWAQTHIGYEMPILKTAMESPMLESRALETDAPPLGDPLRSNLSRAGLRSLRLVPLQTGVGALGAPDRIGVLAFYRSGRGGFRSEERQLADEFGKRVSLALHRARLLEEAQRTANRLEAAVEIAIDLSSSLDPNEVIHRVIKRAAAATDADLAVLHAIEGRSLVVEGVHDTQHNLSIVGLRYPIQSQPLAWQALETGLVLAGGRYRMASVAPASRVGLSSARHSLTVPLTVDGRQVGVLVLFRRGPKQFGEDEVATMEMIRNHAAAALRNARLFARAEESGRTKSEFLNMAAHELRTPLSVVSGYLSMLGDGSFGPIPGHWQMPLMTLNAKVGELGQLIDDLLAASRLEAGALPVASERVDLRLAARAAMGRALPRATVLGAELSSRLGGQPVVVKTDPEQLARILDNLINNAMSYSRGQPWIRVVVGVRSGAAWVAVEDRGRGVPIELRERIFERFFRIDDPDAPHVSGTGLGLYISRNLAERQGGTLKLEWSVVEKGSRFVVTLPLAREVSSSESPAIRSEDTVGEPDLALV